ncbi:MAG: GntR family transcriptional regulator [Microbacteriaceae bacterium]|nr:MAG: GntR family transcriptional regulator [Microbacteriaceae bacterium]
MPETPIETPAGPTPPAATTVATGPISQTASIYARLRTAVLELDLTPGERLTERGLESEFSASRTPVRAALLRLDTEGLVRRDGRGWIVAPIDLDEVRAASEYREAVEAAAVRLACRRASDADLAAVLELLRSLSVDDDVEHGAKGPNVHVELARLSGNPFLVAGVQDVVTRLARTRWLDLRTAQSRAQVRGEHQQILAALEARDADAGTRAVVAHIRNTTERLVASLNADRTRFKARGLTIVGEH